MNSFHEDSHHHHYNPRSRLLWSPSQPYVHLRLEKTLSIAFVTVILITVGYIIFNSICRCLERHHLLGLHAPTNNHNITIDIVPGRASSDAQLRDIPVLVFGSASSPSSNNGGGGGGGAEEKESCSVCLAEYVEGEEVRVLPRCKHMFHKACIDPWLIMRSPFCPICRDRVIELDVCRDGDENNPNSSALRLQLEVRLNMAPPSRVSPAL